MRSASVVLTLIVVLACARSVEAAPDAAYGSLYAQSELPPPSTEWAPTPTLAQPYAGPSTQQGAQKYPPVSEPYPQVSAPYPPAAEAYPPYAPYAPGAPVAVVAPIGEPVWCESPYRNSAWFAEIDFIPTVSHVSDLGFGGWEDDASLAMRLNLGYEEANGIGMRAQLWAFGQEDSETSLGDVDLGAGKFFFDFYKRFFIEEAELVLGAGSAGAVLDYKFEPSGDDAQFRGGGISVFAEGFYPLARFKKSDLGSIARARMTLISGRWDDDGTPFIGDTDHDMMSILELAWGLEFRRRFGALEDKYWYIQVVPEIQRWDSASLSDRADPGFEGTSINFGLAW